MNMETQKGAALETKPPIIPIERIIDHTLRVILVSHAPADPSYLQNTRTKSIIQALNDNKSAHDPTTSHGSTARGSCEDCSCWPCLSTRATNKVHRTNRVPSEPQRYPKIHNIYILRIGFAILNSSFRFACFGHSFRMFIYRVLHVSLMHRSVAVECRWYNAAYVDCNTFLPCCVL